MAADRRPILLIVNPSSGGKPAAPGSTVERPEPEELAASLADGGLQVELHRLAEDDDPHDLAAAAANDGRDVVVAGGDGTVRPAASALIGGEATLGIVPFGSWNNIARGSGIPLDAWSAIEIIRAGGSRRLDVGLAWPDPHGSEAVMHPPADATPFFEAAGIGLEAVGFGAAALGERIGPWRAVRHGWSAMRRRRTPMRLEVDGRRLRTAALAVTVCNGPYYGLGFAVAPDADAADGLLDLVVFSGMSRWDVIRHYLAVARGRPRREPRMRYLKAGRIRVEGASALPTHVDGEPFSVTPVAYAIRPGALRVFAPANGDQAPGRPMAAAASAPNTRE